MQNLDGGQSNLVVYDKNFNENTFAVSTDLGNKKSILEIGMTEEEGLLKNIIQLVNKENGCHISIDFLKQF